MRLKRILPLLVLAGPALASLPEPQEAPLGWTKDGTAFVTTLEGSWWATLDARTGKRTTFTTREAFDAWAAKHPLADDVAEGGYTSASADEPTSPDGKAKVECTGAKFANSNFFGEGFRCAVVAAGPRAAHREARGVLVS